MPPMPPIPNARPMAAPPSSSTPSGWKRGSSASLKTPPPLLRLAARCQHLERWSVPRDSYPLDKPGYLHWRRSLYVKQAERAKELLLQAGVSRRRSG